MISCISSLTNMHQIVDNALQLTTEKFVYDR
jgi:hypothetical protein